MGLTTALEYVITENSICGALYNSKRFPLIHPFKVRYTSIAGDSQFSPWLHHLVFSWHKVLFCGPMSLHLWLLLVKCLPALSSCWAPVPFRKSLPVFPRSMIEPGGGANGDKYRQHGPWEGRAQLGWGPQQDWWGHLPICLRQHKLCCPWRCQWHPVYTKLISLGAESSSS